MQINIQNWMSGEISPLEFCIKNNKVPDGVDLQRAYDPKSGELKSYVIEFTKMEQLGELGLDSLLIRHGLEDGDMFAYWSGSGRYTQR